MVIAFLAIFLCWQNYTSNTWLSGWDTLHPEFNFPLAFERIFNGVWRTDQGLGAVAIQSHMADLPRVIYLGLASLVIPLSFLRYSYFFLMLIAGPLGVYFLISRLIKSNPYSKTAGFVAGLTYLMNLGTLQHFVVPLEMFATHYGLLPWLFLTIIRILEKPSRKPWITFFFLSFFASSQAHTATLFYAYFLCFILFLLTYAFLNRQASLKIILGIILVIISTNAYWLFPNFYAVKTQGSEVRNSKVNRMFSPEALAKNQMFGNIQNAVVLKSFLFDWQIYNYDSNNQGFVSLLDAWNNHAKNPLVPAVGYGVFSLSLFGIFYALRQKNYLLLAFLPIYGLSFLMLLNGTSPIKEIFEKTSQVFPTLAEALRFPFTKFSILFMMTMSIYVGFGLINILNFIKQHRLVYFLTFLYAGLLFYYFLPAFNGNLIHQEMRINIPQEYFQMFSWFNQQDHNKRVAILPIHSFWNWVYYDWGYQGAGFLQFGIPQPILDRDYDRWSPDNEQYQREMADAVYSQDPRLLRSVLKKFNIDYVLFDESIMSMSGRDEETFKWAIPGIIENSGLAIPVANFGKNITIYQVSKTGETIDLYQNLPSVGPKMFGGSEDRTFSSIGPYITKAKDNQTFDNFRAGFIYDEQFVNQIPKDKLVGDFSAAIDTPEPLVSCSKTTVSESRVSNGTVLRYSSTGGSLCDHFSFPNLIHNQGYLLEITSRHIQGFPLQICLSNDFTRHCDLYVNLRKNENMTTERFIIPSKIDMTSGYTVNINNFSIKNGITENEIREITIYQIDYDSLVGKIMISTQNDFLQSVNNFFINVNWTKRYSWFYQISLGSLETSKQNTLFLSQAFNNGWQVLEKIDSFPFFSSIGNHVLVNNWANGWVLSATENQEQRTIYLIFWPQLLEFLGFFLGGAALLWILKPRLYPGS